MGLLELLECVSQESLNVGAEGLLGDRAIFVFIGEFGVGEASTESDVHEDSCLQVDHEGRDVDLFDAIMLFKVPERDLFDYLYDGGELGLEESCRKRLSRWVVVRMVRLREKDGLRHPCGHQESNVLGLRVILVGVYVDLTGHFRVSAPHVALIEDVETDQGRLVRPGMDQLEERQGV